MKWNITGISWRGAGSGGFVSDCGMYWLHRWCERWTVDRSGIRLYTGKREACKRVAEIDRVINEQ